MPKASEKRKKKRDSTSDSGPDPSDEEKPPAKKQQKASGSSSRDENNEVSWTLAKNKMLKIREFKGKVYIDIREYYMNNNGDTMPSKKGISMTPEMYQKFKTLIGEIDEELKKRC